MKWQEVRENWHIIAAFGAGLVAWGVNTADVAAAKEELKDQKTKVEAVQQKLVEIQVAAEGVRAASEAQQRATERQLDQIIEQLRQANAARGNGR